MHPSELLDYGDRALFTFTERPPNSTKQSRWYFGISYHRSDGHTPALHNPFDDAHEWIIYEYIPITDRGSRSQSQFQPAPPPTSFAVYRHTNDYHLQHRPLSTLNVLLPWSSNPSPLGVTTQIIRDQWEASFHLLTHLDLPTHHEEDDMWPAWEWVRDDIINDFLTGRSLEAEDGLVQDGQDFVSIVLADILTDEGIVSEKEYREWWDSVHPHWKGYMEVEGFKGKAYWTRSDRFVNCGKNVLGLVLSSSAGLEGAIGNRNFSSACNA
ncbi:hypothetical protein QBC45DRAFT_489252 [Copromyces sp. CBS 386.78]|nr:hypothetical protein QBC45DRAFT_489252 [Copromyces sp. CBS 386.78]